MDNPRPPEREELVTVGILPVQSFVVQAILLPPGTPARPRPDRAPYVNETPNPALPSTPIPPSSSDESKE